MLRLLLTTMCLLGVHVQCETAADILAKQNNNQWFKDGNQYISDALKMRQINTKAKNVILFLGDGMGVSTVTAARIFAGQQNGKTGEETVLSWEKFPYVGLSKTYTTDYQVADSAGTATAFMTGVKTRSSVVSVDESVIAGDCQSSHGHSVLSMMELAEMQGLSTGIVTTARVTHATPSTGYAHSAHRDWEAEAPGNCTDIAAQLLSFPYGDGPEVVLGGGRRNFIGNTMPDPEYARKEGYRKDGRNLTQEWVDKSKNGQKYEYVWNEKQFLNLDPSKVDHVLGLFDRSHMKYYVDRDSDPGKEPTLSQMVTFSLKMLSKNSKGFFLLVEGGRIDHAHHSGNAYRALSETVQMAEAVDTAAKATNEDDTLIVVTADHSHVFTMAGYTPRGNPILATVPGKKGTDGKSYTSLGYANGPGAKANALRSEPTKNLEPDYQQQSLVPLSSETHGGEDVAIYARGPRAHLLHGTVEQSVIFHLMDYALCLTKFKQQLCASASPTRGAANLGTSSSGFVLFVTGTIVSFLLSH